jgi:hypothetical protein
MDTANIRNQEDGKGAIMCLWLHFARELLSSDLFNFFSLQFLETLKQPDLRAMRMLQRYTRI